MSGVGSANNTRRRNFLLSHLWLSTHGSLRRLYNDVPTPPRVSWRLKRATCQGTRAGGKGRRIGSPRGPRGRGCILRARLRGEWDGRGSSRGARAVAKAPSAGFRKLSGCSCVFLLSAALGKMADVLRMPTEVPFRQPGRSVTSTGHSLFGRGDRGREGSGGTWPKVTEPGIMAESRGCGTTCVASRPQWPDEVGLRSAWFSSDLSFPPVLLTHCTKVQR